MPAPSRASVAYWKAQPGDRRLTERATRKRGSELQDAVEGDDQQTQRGAQEGRDQDHAETGQVLGRQQAGEGVGQYLPQGAGLGFA